MKVIYLLKCDFEDQYLYKIGITKYNARKRISELQTGNGSIITVVNEFESEYNNLIETALHNRYSNKRKKGEWFLLSKENVKSFLKDCQELHDNFKLLRDSNNPFI